MKRIGLFVVVVVAALGAVWLFWSREIEPAEEAARAAQEQGGASSGAKGADGHGEHRGGVAEFALSDAVAQSGAPGSTPPLAHPATEKDGFVEVQVLAQGKPFAGAHVKLYLRGAADHATGQLDWRLAGVAQTNQKGIVRLPARPGAYLIAARAPAFAPAHREVVRPAGESLTRVSVELRAGFSLTGRTVQKGGREAVPLSTVTLAWDPQRERRGGPPMMRMGPRAAPEPPVEELSRATSDSSGRFHIDGLEPGAYHATAVATGYAKAIARAEVPSGKELLLELAQASFIEGYVASADGKPGAGAEVIAISQGPGAEPAVAVASEQGAFSLEVSPRSWAVSAKLGSAAGRADAPVPVAAGATARGVKIQLGAAAQIAGVVIAATSQAPIAGAQLAVSAHNANAAMGAATSDANGNFAVQGLAPGSYDVAVSAAGFSDAVYSGLTVDTGQKFPLRAQLHQTGTVQGIVTDSAGRGVAYALVKPLAGFGQQQTSLEARADEAGNYMLSGVAPGSLQLTALRDGSSLGATGSVEVPEGGTAKLDFQLRDEGAITGHVRRADGTPAPAGTTIRAMPTDNRQMRGDWGALPVDATGQYVASLPAGPYMLGVQGSGGRPGFGGGGGGRNIATVEAGKTVTLDLVYSDPAESSGGFEGTVVEPSGTPSPGAFVRGTTGSGGTGRRGGMLFGASTDETGRFQSGEDRADLPATFQVVAINGGRTGVATVAAGQTTAAVQLQPGATLTGHLTSGPIDQFEVSVSIAQASPLAGGWAGRTQLQFTGDHFVLTDVPGTTVHLVVSTEDGRTSAQDVTLTAGGAQDVQVALQPNASVAGRIVDSVSQQPLSGATIFVDGGGGGGSNTVATSGADGTFSLQVAAGEHSLRVMLQGYRGLAQDFTAQSGQPVQLGSLSLAKQTAASGTIGASLRALPQVVVLSVIPQGPADVAGVKAGDTIVAVDGQNVATVADAQARITGAPGSQVVLTLQRSGNALTVPVTRAP